VGPGRRHERVRIRISTVYEDLGREVFLQALNLSESGLFLASDESPPIGSAVGLVFSLPPEGPFIRARGTVVRRSASTEPSGFAVSFRGLDRRSSSALREFVRNVTAT
jgi:hypothetical protein